MVLARRLEEQFAAEASQTLIGVQLSPGGVHTTAAQQAQHQQQQQQQSPPAVGVGYGPAGASPKPPPTFRAPNDIDTDSESADDEPPASGSLLAQPIARLSPAHLLLQAQQQQLLEQARASGNVKAQEVQQQYLHVEQALQEQLAAVQQELQDKELAWQEAMAAHSDYQRQQRQRILEAAQQQRASHEAAAARARQAAEAQAAAEKRRAAEAAAAAEAQRQAEEAARKQQQEAEAAAAAEAAAKAASSKQQQQQQQKASTPSAAAGTATKAAAGSARQGMAVSTRAAAAAGDLRAKLEAAEAQVAYLKAPEHKQTLRSIRRQLNVLVTSVSETQKQVMAKLDQFKGIYASLPDQDQRMLCCVLLVAVFAKQCDAQLSKNTRSAFALAASAHAIAAEVPVFMELLLAKLQMDCMLLVPQYLMFQKLPAGASEADQAAAARGWQQQLGYAPREDPKTGQQGLESTDAFLERMQGYVWLFGALVQTSWAPTHLPLSCGWSWLASLLNNLPANRMTATAVEAYLAAAGYAMKRRYGRQFDKLLQYLRSDFLPAVAQKRDGQSVVAKLEDYIQQHRYLQPPVGSVMKLDADSNEIKAGEDKYTDPKANRRGAW